MKKQSVFNGEIGQRFSLRKYRTIGLTSVALGSFWLGLAKTNEHAHADTTDDGANSAKVATENNIAGAAEDQTQTETNNQVEAQANQKATSQKENTAKITANESTQTKAQDNTGKADTVSTQTSSASIQADAKSANQDLKVTNLGKDDKTGINKGTDKKSEFVISKAAGTNSDAAPKVDNPQAAEPAKPGDRITNTVIYNYSNDLATDPTKYGFDKYTGEAIKKANLTNSDFHQSVERKISTALDGLDQSNLDLDQKGNLRRIVTVKTEGISDTTHTNDPFNLSDGYPQITASDWMLQVKDKDSNAIKDGVSVNNKILQYEAMNNDSVKKLQYYSANNSGYNVDVLDKDGNKVADGNAASLSWINQHLAKQINVDANRLPADATLADKFHADPFTNTNYQITITTLTKQVNYVFHDQDDQNNIVSDLGNTGSIAFKGLMAHEPTTNGKIGQPVDILSTINENLAKLTDDNGNMLYKLANPNDPNLTSYTFKAENPDVAIELVHNIFNDQNKKPAITDETRDQDGNLVEAMINATVNYHWGAKSDTLTHTNNLQKYFADSDYPQSSYDADYHFVRDYSYDPAKKRSNGHHGVYAYGDWHLEGNDSYSNKGNSKITTDEMNALLHNGDAPTSVIIGYSHTATSDPLMQHAVWNDNSESGTYTIDASDPYSLIGESFKNNILVDSNGQQVTDANPMKAVNETVIWTPNSRTITYTFHDNKTGKDIHVPIIGKDGQTTGKTDDGNVPTGFDPTDPTSPIYGMDTGNTKLPKDVDLGAHKGNDGKWHYNTDTNTKPINFDHQNSGNFDKDHIPENVPITKDDLDRTIKETNEIVKPNGDTSAIEQSVEFTRDGNYDYYTKQVSYTPWDATNMTKAITENGKTTTTKGNFTVDPNAVDADGSKSPNVTLEHVDTPDVDGYVSVGEIPPMTVNADSSRNAVNKITYNANGQTLTVTYRDPFTGEDHDQTFVGKTGDQQKITLTLPKGTEALPDGDKVLTDNPNLKKNTDGSYTYTFTPDKNQTIQVDIHHAYVKAGDENQDITRDFSLNVPGQAPQTIHQEAVFTHPTYIDQATGKKVNQRDYDPNGEDKWKLNTNAKTNTPDQLIIDANGNISFKGADVPQIKGYHANVANIPVMPIAFNAKSQAIKQDIKVVYTANDLTGKIIYLDANNTPIGEGVFHGKTGETIDVGDAVLENVPKNWDIDPAATPQGEYTFKAYDPETDRINPNKPIMMQIVHHMEEARAGEHGLTDYDFNRKITRTINITRVDGTKAYPTTQAVKFSRTGKWDFAANNGQGAFTPDDWTVNSQKQNTYTFDEVDAPVIAGYGANTNAPRITVGPDSQSNVINIHYIKGAHNTNLIYVDDDNSGSQVGSNVQIGGATGDSVDLTQYTKGSYIPAHYDFKSIEEQAGYANFDPTDHYTFNDQDKDNGEVIIHLGHHMSSYDMTDPSNPNYNKLHVSFTRDLNFINANGTSQDIQDHLHFDRSAKKDEATGQIVYGDWSNNGKGSFTDTSIPSRDGYNTIAKDNNAKEIADKLIDKDGKQYLKGYNININGLSDDQIAKLAKTANVNVNIYYMPEEQKVIYQFVDDDLGKSPVGEGLEVDSKTDQAKQIALRVPKNYELAQGQKMPTSFSFASDALKNLGDGHIIDIHLVHQAGIPNGEDVDPATGKTINEMTHKTVYRDVEFTNPITGKTTDQKQSTTFTTKAHKDMVSGKITYDGWDLTNPVKPVIKRDGWSDNGNHVLPGITGGQVDGYKSPIIDPITIHPDTPDTSVKAPDYIATKGQRTIHFVDDKGNEIGHATVNGKPYVSLPLPKDKNGNPIGLPDGWTGKDAIPDTLKTIPTHLDQDPKDTKDRITTEVKHVTVTIEPDKTGQDKVISSDDPSKVGQDIKPGDVIPKTNDKRLDYNPKDLNKDVSRTIEITLPDGTKTSITQTVYFKRPITIDAVTGKSSLGNWTPRDPAKTNFDPITIAESNKDGNTSQLPNIDDYTPHVFDNNGKEIKMPTDKDGKPIVTIPGVKNVPLDYNNKDTGYHVVYELTQTHIHIDPDHPLKPGDLIPGTHIPAPAGLDYDHLNKSINRKINFDLPTGKKTITQTVNAKRGATIDLKTMTVTYDPWKIIGKDSFDKVTVPTVAGYTPSQNEIPGVAHVDPNTNYDTDINIKYTKNPDEGYTGDNGSYSGIISGNTGNNNGSDQTNSQKNKNNQNSQKNKRNRNSKDDKSRESDLQKQINDLKKRVNNLANKIDNLASHRVGNSGNHKFNGNGLRMSGNHINGNYGNGYGYDYDNGYANGLGYGNNQAVQPSGYINYNYGSTLGANAIDRAARNGYGRELPQTGNEDNTALMMLGMLSLGLSAAAAIGATKKKKQAQKLID